MYSKTIINIANGSLQIEVVKEDSIWPETNNAYLVNYKSEKGFFSGTILKSEYLLIHQLVHLYKITDESYFISLVDSINNFVSDKYTEGSNQEFND